MAEPPEQTVCRPPDDRLGRLRRMLEESLPRNRFYRAKLAKVDCGRLGDLLLTCLPFTTKAELVADQEANPPYGTNLSYPLYRYSRLHQTSGTTEGRPLVWLDTTESWAWFLGCWETIYRVVGLRADDRLFFPFSFGPFLGFWGAFEGAARLGNLCIAGGGMSSTARLRVILDHGITVVACTPTYALRLAEVAVDEQIDLAGSAVRALVVAGEPGGSIPATRAAIERAWGARVFDHWGMTELGALAIECRENPGGLHLLEDECIPEVIDPATGHPTPPGEMGELVVTNLGRWGSPLIRYRTGDLVRPDPAPCSCGRSWLRLAGGVLGRADDMVIIRGNNVYPSAVEAIVRDHPEIAEFRARLVRRGSLDDLELELEPNPAAAVAVERLCESVARRIQDVLHFRPIVRGVACGSLPRFELKARRWVKEGDR